jgi:hypothetical protein
VGDSPELDLSGLSAHEQRMLDSIDDADRRNVVACSLVAHRRQDRLEVGDSVPDLSLARLDGGEAVRLAGYVDDRPLVLVFGSFT